MRPARFRLLCLLALAAWACTSKEEGSSEQPAPTLPPEPAPPPTAAPSAEPSPPPLPDRWGDKRKWDGTLAEQNAYMFDQLEAIHGVGKAEREQLEAIFQAAEWMSQGNPEITEHPITVAECRAKLEREKVSYDDPRFEAICGGKYMAPLYDPDTEKPEDARTCIDRFEFPNIPCAYPVTWARANEAAEICRLLGKRMCDAHEWEGACWGKLEPPDYDFKAASHFLGNVEDARKAMRGPHNVRAEKTKRWAYGTEYKSGVCATGSKKSEECSVIGWKRCGANTYPAGSFPSCMSPLGVQDLHGNAAEHMNLPLTPEQMASAGNQLGQTEMKGSWFVFDLIKAHEDHCRWRAPDWHGGPVMSPNSHRNYHLGFRCCKSLPER